MKKLTTITAILATLFAANAAQANTTFNTEQIALETAQNIKAEIALYSTELATEIRLQAGDNLQESAITVNQAVLIAMISDEVQNAARETAGE